MKLGIENKKQFYTLIVLVGGLAAYLVYDNFLSGPTYAPAPAASRAPMEAAAPAAEAPAPGGGTAQSGGPPRAPGARSDAFKPKLRNKRGEDHPDPTKIDPTLRLDLLAKLQEVPAPAGTHNLFQIGSAPATKPEGPKGPEPVILSWNRPPPLPPPPPPPGEKQPPPLVPINVKYYGWAAPTGTERKRAFFLDGDNVIVKYEGESIKGHYRVMRIGPGVVVVEDTNDKRQQTLNKVEDSTV
jgi:hypothetical protein